MKKKLILAVVIFFNLSISLLIARNLKDDCQTNNISIDNEFTLRLSDEQDLFEEWVQIWDTGYRDWAEAISLDSSENVYIAGFSLIDSNGTLFVVKFDKEGIYQWNQTWDTFNVHVRAMAIDSSDNIYVVSSSYPSSDMGIYLVKFNSSGDLQWFRIWDNLSYEIPYSLVIDSLDNIYITGYSYINPGNVSDVLLLKYNSSGDEQWFRTWGGIVSDMGYDLVIDSSDDIYLTGRTKSYGAGGEDMLLMKYNSSGTLQWYYTLGSDHPSIPDRGYEIVLDSLENIYVKGIFEVAGTYESVLVKCDHSGTYIWNITYQNIKSPSYDSSNLAIDSLDNFFMLCSTYLMKCNSSGDFLWGTDLGYGITGIALDSDNNLYYSRWSGDDAFLGKYSSKPQIVIDSPQIGEFFGITPPDFNLSIIEPDGDTSWYSVDGGTTKVTFQGSSGQISQTEWDKLLHGTHIIQFHINDSEGNEGFSDVEINKDIQSPQITIYEPIASAIYEDLAPNYTISVLDDFFYNNSNYNTLNSVWYTIDGGNTNTTLVNPNSGLGTINQLLWSNAPYENITIRFYASDNVGNINFKEVNVEKRPEEEGNGGPESPTIPGYGLLLIIGIMSVITVILIKKWLKK